MAGPGRPTNAEREARANGVSENLPDGWNTWPGLNEAARRLGCAHSVITKLVRDGAVQKVVGPDLIPRYSPKDIEESRGLFEEEQKNTGGLSHEEFRAGNELVKQVLSHHEKMVPLLAQGYEAMLRSAEARIAAIAGELATKNARIVELEKERDENAKAREKAISEEHTRLLAEKTIDAQERRKDKAFNAFTDKFAPLLLQKAGLGDPKMQIGNELLGSIKREQLLGLLAIQVLDPKQTALVLKLLQPLTPEEKEALVTAGVIPATPGAKDPTQGKESTS